MGQAVAGFGVSVLSFLTLWAAPSGKHGEVRRPADVAGAAFAYFGLSAAVVAASVAGYWGLQQLPFWHFYTRTADGREGAHRSKCLLRGTSSVQGLPMHPYPALQFDPQREKLRGKDDLLFQQRLQNHWI